MGSACCKDEGGSAVEINEDWADAVSNGNAGACQFMHGFDPSIIETPVNKQGQRAIHIAAANKHHELLKYLLENNADVNIKAHKTGNTPLHEAAAANDATSINMLLQHDANPQIRNRKKLSPKQLAKGPIPKLFNRTNIKKAKESKKTSAMQQRPGDETLEPMIGGKSIQDTTKSQRMLFAAQSTAAAYTFKGPTTDNSIFAAAVGVEIEEVANFFQRLPNKMKIWNKFVDSKDRQKSEITTEQELFRLLYGLTYATLKKKNKTADKPTKSPIRDLTHFVAKKFKTKSNDKKTLRLTKEQFKQQFYSVLYTVAEEMKHNR